MREHNIEKDKNTVLGACAEYAEQSKKYGLKDVLSAFILYIVLLVEFILMGNIFVNRGTTINETFIFTITGFMALSIISFVCLLCVAHKHKFRTVGFSKTHWFNSFKIGMCLSIIVVIWGLIRIFIFHGVIRNGGWLISSRIVYYMVFIGFMEEFVFRGYIGTRLYGFIPNKKLSIVIAGIMFSLLHVPFQAIIAQVAPLDYLMTNSINLLIIFIMHIGFQHLYAKYNSIIAPTMFHFIWDFSQWLIR